MSKASSPQKKYLITGGSGFLGINLVRYLLNKDQLVRVLDLAEFDYPEKPRVDFIKGDIRDREKVSEAVSGVDLVIHAAAALPLYSREDIYSTDVDGTRNVLEAARESSVERVIHISSTAVYGIPDHHPLKEDDPLNGVGPYGDAKIKAEEVCLEYRQKGMCVPILRPKSFIGPERLGVFALFYDWARSGRGFPLIGKGNNRYQFLDVEDLCEAIYLAATLDQAAVNDNFNIGAKDFATMKEDFQAVIDYAGYGKRIKTLPAAPIIAALKVLEFFRLSPLYQWVYETAATDSYVSVEKAERILGFKPRYSNREALIRNYEWYLNNISAFEKQSGVSHRVPWNQGVLKLAKYFF